MVGESLAVPADLLVRVFELVQVIGEVAEVHPDAGHDPTPVRAQQRAVVAGLDPRQVLGPLVHAVRHRPQQLGPLGAGQRSPRGKGGPRGRDGSVYLLLTTGVHLGDDRLVDR